MRILSFFKKYWLFILLGFLTTFVISSRFLFSQSKNKTYPLSNIVYPTPPTIEGMPLPPKIQFEIENYPSLEKIMVYKGIEKHFSLEKAEEIAKKLGFKSKPEINQSSFDETICIWRDKNNSLSINLQKASLTYERNIFSQPLPQKGELPTQEEAEKIFNQFLNKLDLFPDYTLESQPIRYLSFQTNSFIENPKEKAEVIKIGANPLIDKNILVTNVFDQSPIFLLLDKKREIVRFDYHLPFSSFIPQKEYSLKSKEIIKKSILKEGKIVYISGIIMNKEITFNQITFNRIEIAYFQPSEKNLIQPIFILQGNGFLIDNQVREIVAYLPAISFP